MNQPDAPSENAAPINMIDVIRLLRSGGDALFAQAALHGQLARVEWAEERHRFMLLLITTLLGFACLLCLMFSMSAFLLVLVWDSPYRVLTMLSLISFYALCTLFAWYCFQRVSAKRAQAFIGTREELAADITLLRSRL